MKKMNCTELAKLTDKTLYTDLVDGICYWHIPDPKKSCLCTYQSMMRAVDVVVAVVLIRAAVFHIGCMYLIIRFASSTNTKRILLIIIRLALCVFRIACSTVYRFIFSVSAFCFFLSFFIRYEFVCNHNSLNWIEKWFVFQTQHTHKHSYGCQRVL